MTEHVRRLHGKAALNKRRSIRNTPWRDDLHQLKDIVTQQTSEDIEELKDEVKGLKDHIQTLRQNE